MCRSPVEAASRVESDVRGGDVQLLPLRLTLHRPGSEWWLGAGIAITLTAAAGMAVLLLVQQLTMQRLTRFFVIGD